ncbi:MAG: DUF1501 domain-containing protein [Planctomycetales bacterium]|nr:DUF1501 domain-containing protein [Planctomycetales bacterium]MCA9170193.1 DUF1501 domain-containing protein [Planctomycetales bacterium]
MANYISRRHMLQRCSMGFGAVALTALLQEWNGRASLATTIERQPHHAPRVRSVIFLYMDGGPSQVDTFDYKPLLERFHGQDPREAMGKLEPTQFNNIGRVMQSPWKFARYGESGNWVSDLLPKLREHIDDLAFLKGMTSKFSEHTFGNYFLHTGSGLQGRPSMGAWVNYALGSENENLPGYVVLNGGLIPPGGLDNFNSGFLPATYQGSVFQSTAVPVANIQPRERDAVAQRRKLDLIRSLDQFSLRAGTANDALESAIANYETAHRMQSSVPDLMDLSGESPSTLAMYGFDDEWAGTRTYARQCLLARRLVERGVRFIELTCPGGNGDRWDQHSNLRDGHTKNCHTVDQPIAALLTDLKERGLLSETLVVWAGEFGRTPFAQGSDGRDHNPYGFTVWLAGGGVRGGASYGETDEWGYKAIDGKLEIHDLHATMLHLLGVDHERSTYRFGGRDMRLTDVHGHVVQEILA